MGATRHHAWVLGLTLAMAASASGAKAETSDADDAVQRILAIDADPAYGEYLAGECATCHRREGADANIPPIAGLPREHFTRALVEYKTGLRTNEVMKLMTDRLGDAEIAALAAHFADQ